MYSSLPPTDGALRDHKRVFTNQKKKSLKNTNKSPLD